MVSRMTTLCPDVFGTRLFCSVITQYHQATPKTACAQAMQSRVDPSSPCLLVSLLREAHLGSDPRMPTASLLLLPAIPIVTHGGEQLSNTEAGERASLLQTARCRQY